MIKKLDARLALLLTVVAALVVLLVGWFGLISAQRSKASNADTQIAQHQDQLTAEQALLATSSKATADAQLRAAEKVLPNDPRMSQVVREIQSASVTSSTQIDSVVPAPVAAVGSGAAVPIAVTLEGQYFAIRQFLAILQAGASIKKNKVVGDGRLYSVDSIQFTQQVDTSTAGSAATSLGSSSDTPGANVKHTVKALIDLNVFIGGTAPAPAPAPTTATDSSSTSSDTSTTASGATP
jgi:Pilus assembly protein, PilO